MITLQLLKEDIAQNNGFSNWEALVNSTNSEDFNSYVDILTYQYAGMVAQHNLNRAADQALCEWAYGKIVGVDKDSIRSTEIELL